MSNSAIGLTSIELIPCDDVIMLLEEALERAKSGEIRAIGLVCELQGRATSTAFAYGDGDAAHIVFAIERLKYRLINE